MLEKSKQRTDILKILNNLKLPHELLDGHYDTQHNDTQHNVIQHNDIQHNDIPPNDIQH
jgi:hypothetical protein